VNNQSRPAIRFVADPLAAPRPRPIPTKRSCTFGFKTNLLRQVQAQPASGIWRPSFRKARPATLPGTGVSQSHRQVYQEGAGLVVAANLERLIEKTKPELTKGAGGEQRETR